MDKRRGFQPGHCGAGWPRLARTHSAPCCVDLGLVQRRAPREIVPLLSDGLNMFAEKQRYGEGPGLLLLLPRALLVSRLLGEGRRARRPLL